MKHIITLSYLLLLLIVFPVHAMAQEKDSGSSAALITSPDAPTTIIADTRVPVVAAYLQKQDSPLLPYAADFVQQADAYQLPWDLVLAISGAESSFGKSVPCINAWGWHIYGTNMYCFDSYAQGIQMVSADIRNQYINAWGDDDVYKLGHDYAASPAWPGHVISIMQDIESFKQQYDAQHLSINL